MPALALVAAGLVAVAPASDATGGASLTVTPMRAAPGEPLTLVGSLPTKVRRPVAVQRGMYGHFFDVAHGRTDKHGHFRLQIPKNGMGSDPYRVVARKVRVHHHVYRAITSPVRTIKTLEPDVSATLSATSVGVGGTATLTAAGTPVRPGRPLTLQSRTSPTTWRTIGATAKENARGQATFTLPTATAGTTTYRVVAGAWNGMGWMPSFPVTLSVGTATPRTVAPARSSGAAAASRKAAMVQPGPVNAANTFKWGPMAERWEWEAGESTDPWQIYSDGTGRSSIYMAMLALESGPQGGQMVSTGTVKATLQNAGHTYGRWEARVRGPIFQSGNADYTMGLDLVPTCATAATPCTGPSVNLGTWTGYQSPTTIGVCKGTTAWSTTRSLARNRDNWHTLGVEITPKRIVWFIDAKVAAVLNNSSAVPGVPLVPQLVLRGKPGDVRMNRTKLTADWVRYYTLKQKDKGRIAGSTPTASSTSNC
jgi:hypothetical protein